MNKVWIELEVLDENEQINHELNEARAKLASTMLEKLGYNPGKEHYQTVTWWRSKGAYTVVLDAAGSFQLLEDKGHWFNLDYLGREIPKVDTLDKVLGPTENIGSLKV